MSDKMVLLAIYGNPVEAELARSELQAEGIPARVMGATSGDLFAGLGVGLSNVQLLVPEGDYERATRRLAEETDVARESRENREREAERRRRRNTAIKEPDAAEAETTDIRPAESPAKAEPDPAEPPESVEGDADDAPPEQLPDAEGDDEGDERPLTWTRDDLAARAFRASLFGYFTLGILHAYALWMLSAIPFTEGSLSPAGARKAWAALALALLPWLVVLILIWNALS
jgi:hypothetical protein